jgi:signal transduction histidine kinase
VRALNSQSPKIEELMQSALRDGAGTASYLAYLKAVSSGAAEARGLVNLRQTIDFVVDAGMPKIQSHARVHKHLAPVPPVLGSEARFGQVFWDLLINAAQSFGPGEPETHRIDVSTFTDESGWAVAEIRDTGSGISPDELKKIFEPFYSTKRGAGLGLGLFVVRNTIAEAGGRIAVESEVGRGSTFRISLPPAPAPVREP